MSVVDNEGVSSFLHARSLWRAALSSYGAKMLIFKTFETFDFIQTFIGLVVAFVLGTAIGAERQWKQRSAGLRTNVLVSLGACQFVDIAMKLDGGAGGARVVSYVVSGIGFLGAGVIMKDGLNIRGLNTAATLWCSAAVGACAGANLAAQAALLTLFVITANTLLQPLVNRINRAPLLGSSVEAIFEVNVLTTADAAGGVRKAVMALLQAAHYPVSDLELIDRQDDRAEVVATLVMTAVEPRELDAVCAKLEAMPAVSSATWSSSTEDLD
jgi:putative Mg2+ transporter-C (MgtC) family protein